MLLDCFVPTLVHNAPFALANCCPCIPHGLAPVATLSKFYVAAQNKLDHRVDVVGEPPPSPLKLSSPSSTLCIDCMNGETLQEHFWSAIKLAIIAFLVIFVQDFEVTNPSTSSLNFCSQDGMKHGETTQASSLVLSPSLVNDKNAPIHGETVSKPLAAILDAMFSAPNLLQFFAMDSNTAAAIDSLSCTGVKNNYVLGVCSPIATNLLPDKVAKVDFQVHQDSISNSSISKITFFAKSPIEAPLYLKNASCYPSWHETPNLWGAYIVARLRPPPEPPPNSKSRSLVDQPVIVFFYSTCYYCYRCYKSNLFFSSKLNSIRFLTLFDVHFERGVTRFKSEWMLLAS